MRGKQTFLLVVLSFVQLFLFAQEYSFTHYDKQEGLPGSIAYGMTQDKDGFLWIGTETGLSRFDGSRFVNYSTLDGLPDNEVLNVFADSKGRVWIMPFRVSICYYYKGKFFTNENDSLLSKVKLATHAAKVSEDSKGNILIQEFGKNIFLITTDGRVINFTTDSDDKVFIQSARREAGGFWIQQGSSLYILENRKMTLVRDLNSIYKHYLSTSILPELMAWRTGKTEVTISNLNRNQVIQKIPLPDDKARILLIEKGTAAFCTREGAYIHPFGQHQPVRRYLENRAINFIFIDDERNWWFCTYGNGIYRLNSESVKNLYFNNGTDRNYAINTLAQSGSKLLAGCENGIIYTFNFQNDTLVRGPQIQYPEKVKSPIIDICVRKNGRIVFGSPVLLLDLDSNFRAGYHKTTTSTKKIIESGNDEVLVATGINAFRLDLKKKLVTDTLWNTRTTTIFKKGDTIYLGTLSGLYCLLPGKPAEFLGSQIALLKNRVISISQTTNGVLWIATYGNGIVGLRDNRLFAHLSEEDGLKSNICRATAANGDYLWVGTDRGISKIYTADRRFPIVNYSTTDGLAAEAVNAVLVADSLVFIGTSNGLTYFKEKLLTQESSCRLRITGVQINNSLLAYDTSGFILEHDENNIRIDYVGISFRSQGDIEYKYRLLGLDSTWLTTREMSLSYPALPSGQYEFQIQAINRYGVASSLVPISFTIKKTIWEKAWVRALLSLIFLLFIVLITMLISRRIKKREEEKARINQRMAEMEQLALKSQMNPHFIFNSLNSIQQYVMDKDIAGANKFISDFSRLIRQTLDFSSKPFVSLTDEINYIATYLELEKTRLEGKFNYQIDISPELKGADFPIPPMILQPYVENSIRHGIRYRKDDLGMIHIRVSRHNQYIVVVIEDNGIGRKMAAYYKTANPIEYQSKGMSLTADRLELINRNFSNKITVLLEDLVDQSLEPLGTRVTINFPEEYI